MTSGALRLSAAWMVFPLLLALAWSAPRAQELEGSRRVEILPASSWMDAPPARLRLGAGQPVLLEGSSQSWIEGHLRMGRSLFTSASASLLRAGAFQLRDLSGGLRVGLGAMQVGACVHHLQRGVDMVTRQGEWRGGVLVVWEEGFFKVGLRGRASLPRADVSTARAVATLAAQLRSRQWGMGVSREDSPWQAAGIWRAGFSLSMSSSVLLAVRGGMSGGALVLALRRGNARVTVAVPVATLLPAGPYFALDWFAFPKDGDG